MQMSDSRVTVSLNAATDASCALGKGGKLIYSLRQDMQHFYEKTRRSVLIMGRKTLESFPNGPLQGRPHVVLTRDKDLIDTNKRINGMDICYVGSPEEADDLAQQIAIEEGYEMVSVIGGGEVYKAMMPFCDVAYMTWIDSETEDADTFFPIEAFNERFPPTTGQYREQLTENGIYFCYQAFEAISAPASQEQKSPIEASIHKGVLVMDGLVIDPESVQNWWEDRHSVKTHALITLKSGGYLQICRSDIQPVVEALRSAIPDKEVPITTQEVISQ